MPLRKKKTQTPMTSAETVHFIRLVFSPLPIPPYLRRSIKYKNPVPVGVNGKQYLVQRGVDVEVPESVAEVLKNSMNQDTYALSTMADMQKGADW